MNNLTKEQVLDFVKVQWKALALGLVIVFSLIVTLGIPSGKMGSNPVPLTNSRNSTGGNSGNITPTKKPFNPFGIFGNSKNTEQPSAKVKEETALKNINSGNLVAPIPSVITKIDSTGAKTTKPLIAGTTVQTTQGSIETNANIQTGVTSNTQQDNIAIVFDNGDGTNTTYIPPGTPPGEVRWGRYVNTKSKYAINYPVNWQFVYSIDAKGYEGVTLYPPDADLNDPKSPYIFFTFSTEPFNLSDLSLSDADKTPLTVDGVKGTLFTNGPIGKSYVTSILDYLDGKFGLGASKSDETFAYIYYYMLHSLTFNYE